MGNKYDDLVSDEYSKVSAPVEPDAAPVENKYDQLIKEDSAADQAAIKQSMTVATEKKPDHYAQVLDLAKKSNLSTQMVEENFDDLQKSYARDSIDYAKIQSEHPQVAKWLQEPDNAAVSHDDLDSLKKLEDHTSDHAFKWQMANSIGSGFAGMAQQVAALPALGYNVATLAANQVGQAHGITEVIPKKYQEAPDWMYDNPVTQNLDMVQKYYQARTPDAQNSIIRSLPTNLSDAMKIGNYEKAAKSLVLQSLQSAPQQVAIIAAMVSGVGELGLIGMGVGSAAQKNAQLKKENPDLGYENRTANAVATGTAEAAFEKIGTFGLLDHWEKAMAKQWGKQATREVLTKYLQMISATAVGEGAEEAATSVSQDVTDYVSGANPDLGIADVGENALNSFMVGGFSGGVMTSTAGAIQGHKARTEAVNQMNRDKEFYTAFGETAEQAKLKARSPESLKRFIEQATQGTAIENVYIPVAAMEEYFQSQKLAPAAVMNELGATKAYEEAKATGGDIKIPLAQWTDRMIGTEHYAHFKDNVKFQPDGQTAEEIKISRVRADEDLKKTIEENKKLIDEDPVNSQAKEDIKQQIIERITAVAQQQRDAATNPKYGKKEIAAIAEIEARNIVIDARDLGEAPMERFRKESAKFDIMHAPTPGEVVADEVLNQGPAPKRSVLFPVKQAGNTFTVNPSEGMSTMAHASPDAMNIVDLQFNPKYLGVVQDSIRSVEKVAIAKGLSHMTADIPKEHIKFLRAPYEAQGFSILQAEDGSYIASKSLGKVLYQDAKAGPTVSPLGFYSQVEAEVQKMDFKEMPAKDLANRINNIQGIKKEELEWLGLNEWLKLQDGKVSKQQVIDFINQNGVQVEQVVLAENFASEGMDAAGVEWDEQERDNSGDSDDISNEMDYYIEDPENAFGEETLAEWKAEAVKDNTDEDGDVNEMLAEEAYQEKIRSEAEKRATEYIESDDYHGARYTVNTNIRVDGRYSNYYSLHGSDEMEWYSPDFGDTMGSNLEEAKIKLVARLLEDGIIEGDKSELSRVENLEWRRLRSEGTPADATIKKKAKALFAKDKAKFMAEAVEYYKDDKFDTEAERAKKVDEQAQWLSEKAIEKTYEDPDGAKNKLVLSIDHPLVQGGIRGNNVKGWVLEIDDTDNESLKPIKLEAKTVEDAKKEATAKMVELKLMTDAKKADPAADVNEPTGQSKHHSSGRRMAGGENYREFVFTLPKNKGETFTYSGHFPQDNFFAHARVTDRVDGQGRKTLFVEEVQSDWHQQGREKGYSPKNLKERIAEIDNREDELSIEWNSTKSPYFIGDALDTTERFNSLDEKQKALAKEYHDLAVEKIALGKAVPDAPFKNTETWTALVMKRMLRLAVEQGYEAVAWTPAQVHVDRWGTDDVSWVKVSKKDTSEWEIAESSNSRKPFTIYDKRNEPVTDRDFETRKDAQDYIDSLKEDHFLVGSAEQRGGNVDGMNIEEIARQRGQLLERSGDRVTNKEGLREVIASTLGRERNDKSLDSLTERIWKGMQSEDQHTGQVQPRKEGMEFFYNKMIPDVTKKLLKKLDPAAKIEVGKIDDIQALEIQITEPMKAEIQKGFSLFQDQPGDYRGSITLGAERIIKLGPKADLSTLIHETAHGWLDRMGKDYAKLKQIPEEKLTPGQKRFMKRAEQGLSWLGAKSFADITVDQHETFARSAEAYFREGKAPVRSLRKIFAQFKMWMTQIYRQARQLDVEMHPEVRDFFDRMIATEDEIQTAESSFIPLLESSNIMGSKAERYEKAKLEAHEFAKARVEKELLEDFQKSERAFYKEKEKGVKLEVKAELEQDRAYKAVSILQSGELPDGSAPPASQVQLKISSSSLKEIGAENMPRGISDKDGMHVELVAPLLNYADGAALVAALSNLPKLQDAIDTEAKKRMAEYYPDSLTDGTLPKAAIEAVHNDKRAEMLNMELEFLRDHHPTVEKEAAKRIIRRVPPQAVVREQAQALIGEKSLKEIQPHVFLLAERKAAKAAAEAYVKGDLDEAFIQKKKELLNHELYRAATDAKNDQQKHFKKWRRIYKSDEKISKSRDIDIVNAARAVLASHGVTRAEKTAEEYLSKMKQYDPDHYETIKALVDSAVQNPGPIKDMIYNDFVDMRDAVNALWDLAKSSREIEIEGKKMDREVVKAELMAQAAEYVDPAKQKEYTEDAGKWDQVKMHLLDGVAAMTRVEHWADAMGAAYTKYIWRPVSQGVTKYRNEKEPVIKKYESILKKYKHLFLNKNIFAPEIGHKFTTTPQLLMYILHTGNESNKRKLLVGRRFAELDADGDVDTKRHDAMIDRMQKDGTLTKEHYDLAQELWDLMETLKPGAQKAHKSMYGTYFNEITANEIVTPWGAYRGGYIPAKLDVLKSDDAKIRAERESFEKNNNSYMYPTTGRGFTKSRIETYAGPLSLDMNLLGGHIDQVLRFTHIEPRVKEVTRIVLDKEFAEALKLVDPSIKSAALVPWLQRAAQQKIIAPPTNGVLKNIDAMAGYLRTAAAMQLMFGNVVNAAQQFTGIFVAASKVKPYHLRNAVVTYLGNPKRVSADMIERSAWMKSTQGSNIYESAESIKKILIDPNVFQSAKSFMRQHMYFMQSATQNIINTVVWVGAYNQALTEKLSEYEAVQIADGAVRMTQGTSQPEDMSHFETGTQTARAFTMFTGYFNMLANVNKSGMTKISRGVGLKKGAGKAFYLYTSTIMLPAVIAGVIVRAMGNGFDDDDDGYLDDALSLFFGEQFKTMTALIPYVGQPITAAVNTTNNKQYDDRISLSPIVSLLEQGIKASSEVYDVIVNDVDKEKMATKDILVLLGLMTSLPVGPIGRPVGYLMDVGEGNAQPTGPIDFTRGLITGKSGYTQ